MTIGIFLDSGAYSAYSKGVQIKIEEYAEYIKQNKKYLTAYANLDVIGDPKKTYENQIYLEKQGLNPIPTFHYGEPEKWLSRYLKKGHDYIALGGMVPISSSCLLHWLDHIWSTYLVDSEKMPIVKVHGFGMTILKLMFRYPWYSVDSTTWILNAAMGNVYVPITTKGQYDYTKPPVSILVSHKAEDKANHLNRIPPRIKEKIIQYIQMEGFKLGRSVIRKGDKLEYDEKWYDRKKGMIEKIIEVGVTNSHIQRKFLNYAYFKKLSTKFKPWPHRLELQKIGFF